MDYKALEALMGELQVEMLENMLKDIRDEDKRTPAFYNALIKELERNGINIVPKAGDGEDSLSKLLTGVQQAFDEDNMHLKVV